MVSSIYEWSINHIKTVFEAKTEESCVLAIDETFSHGIEATVNGKPLSRMELQRFVLSMVKLSGFRLNVQWQNAVEVPRDSSNRVCNPSNRDKLLLTVTCRMAHLGVTMLFAM